MAQVTLGAHDRAKFFDVLFHRSADERVAVFAPFFHFGGGVAKARGDLIFALGAALAQAAAEFIESRRHYENIGERVLDESVRTLADAGGAERIDIEQDIDAMLQLRDDGGLERAVMVAVDLGVFQEISGLDVGLECFLGEKMVILAVDFSGPRGAGRARDGVNEIRLLAERGNERGFSRARGGGDDEKNAGALDVEVTQCWRVVRGCGRVRPSPR